MNLDPDEARRRFTAARRAHLATADAEGVPHIVPVTFACAGDRVYIAVDAKPKRSHDLRRLRNIRENPDVALLADRYDDDWSRLWWVRADGSARVLDAEHDEAEAQAGAEDRVQAHAERRRMIGLLQARYPQYLANVPQGPVIEVSVSRWSGWAFADPHA